MMVRAVDTAYIDMGERFRLAVQGGEEGQGMVEYGLIVALISVVAIAVITLVGGGLTNNFHKVVNAL